MLALLVWMPAAGRAATATLTGWNDLGMHCMDGLDFSVFSILPPYNTIHAQLIVQGKLATNLAGITVTYEAVADPAGSINATSQGKGNFWDYAQQLYSVNLAQDAGLAGFSMPGTNNTPRLMHFNPTNGWFSAEGIPITPYDDSGAKNYYPMMKLTARDQANNVLASTRIVLPVSDEMSCQNCHASDVNSAAAPFEGMAWDIDPVRDYKLNILRKHDEGRLGNNTYPRYLAQAGYNTLGLYATVKLDGKPVLCARCHKSNALPGTGLDGIPPLTQSIHSFHAYVMDPVENKLLNDSTLRSACYQCHPGSTTKCLRGAMGSAVATDGAMAMHCQSCHGSMNAVGSDSREGWLEEPSCQNCHSGNAISNNGLIRFTSTMDTTNHFRQAVNTTFATTPNVPASGYSLFRFSRGHGGLYCEACHGSTHAEYPSSHTNDNVQAQSIQGHVGVLAECTACHSTSPNTTFGGPHGMHPVGQPWFRSHSDVVERNGATLCQPCHGADYKGTVLSRTRAGRALSGEGINVHFWKGYQVGCYSCHNGTGGPERGPAKAAPTIQAVTASTASGNSVSLTLKGTSASGLALVYRIVSQPAHGTLSLQGASAVYFPETGFVGNDSFTYSAFDVVESSLGTGQLTVAQGSFALFAQTHVPPDVPALIPAPFAASVNVSNLIAIAACDWDFGDGTAHGTTLRTSHIYSKPGIYFWKLTAAASNQSVTNSGTIRVDPPISLSIVQNGGQVVVSWALSSFDLLLDRTDNLLPGAKWQSVTNAPLVDTQNTVTLDTENSGNFFRLKR